VLDKVLEHEVYLFLDDFLGYHQINITLEDYYKTTFITNWGSFVWAIMSFGLNNAPPNLPMGGK
jgi:hypothetical protein